MEKKTILLVETHNILKAFDAVVKKAWELRKTDEKAADAILNFLDNDWPDMEQKVMKLTNIINENVKQ